MLATGGTIVQAIDECIARGANVKNIRIVCAVTCPPALTILSEKYPGLRVYAAMIDEELNDDAVHHVPGPARRPLGTRCVRHGSRWRLEDDNHCSSNDTHVYNPFADVITFSEAYFVSPPRPLAREYAGNTMLGNFFEG